MYDLIIIGGGPAGLTAASYAIRKRLNLLILSRDLGGKTNYRLSLPWITETPPLRGAQIAEIIRKEVEGQNVPCIFEPIERVCQIQDAFAVTARDTGDLLTRAVIIASGARQQRLNIPGEKTYLMRGLCYSALSYAPLFVDRTVVVIGDNDLAQRAAVELATVAKQVYLVCAEEELTETRLAKKLVAAPNVDILKGLHAQEVKGDAGENSFARKILLGDAYGRTTEITCDGIFIEKALVPNSQFVTHLINLDLAGRIRIDSANRTNIPGIFAAGDVTSNCAEDILVAIGEGAKAALSAYDYLI